MIFKVLRGENLPASDVNGKSDPFVKVHYDGRELGTSIRIKRNLNPIWDFTMSFPLVHASWMYLVVEVWDRDELSANDLLGALRIPFPEWRQHVAIYQEKIKIKKKKLEEMVARQAALAAAAATGTGTGSLSNKPGHKTLNTNDLGGKSHSMNSNTMRPSVKLQQQQNNKIPGGNSTTGSHNSYNLRGSSVDQGNLITSPRAPPLTHQEKELEEEEDDFFSHPIYFWSSLVKGSMAKGRILCSFQFEEKDMKIFMNQPYGTDIQQIFLPQNPRFQQVYCHLPRSWHPDPNVRQQELSMLHAGTPKDCLFPWHEKLLHMIEEVTVTFHVNEANQGVLATMVLTNYRVWFVPYRRVKGLLHEDVHTISIGKILKASVSQKKRKGMSSSSGSTSSLVTLVLENMDAGLYHVTLSPLSRMRGENAVMRDFSREAEAKRIKQLQNIVAEIEWLRIENSFCSTKDLNHELVLDDKDIESSMITASAASAAASKNNSPQKASSSSSCGSSTKGSPSKDCSSSSTHKSPKLSPPPVPLKPPTAKSQSVSSGLEKGVHSQVEGFSLGGTSSSTALATEQQRVPLSRAVTMGNLTAATSGLSGTHTAPAGGRPPHHPPSTIGGHSTTMTPAGNPNTVTSGPGAPVVYNSLRRRIRYDAETEFRRQGALRHPRWRVTHLNENYQMCATYPSFLMVPANLRDDVIFEASRFRSKNRLPVLTWIHPRTGAPLCRSSQPNTGVLRSNNTYDKELIWAIRDAAVPSDSSSNTLPKKNKVLNIVDARPEINAKSNALAGKGHESVKQYDRDGMASASITFMGIDNIHVVRNSFAGLAQALYQVEDGNFFGAVQKCKWLEHVSNILLGACEVASHLERGQAVLVHCSDGWDRTAQLSALAQVMLDPYFRTLEGFAILIEKDWCSFGHMFKKRCGHPTSDQTSPIFMQFLDAVYQLTLQFPTHFQFNELFLSFIAEAVYSSWFGTFQENSEKDRRIFLEKVSTISVWDVTRASTDQYLNPLFNGGESEGGGGGGEVGGLSMETPSPHHHQSHKRPARRASPSGGSNKSLRHGSRSPLSRQRFHESANTSPMIPVCRVRIMQLWCSQYQKAISHMRLQQREFEMLALIRQQELELSRISSVLTMEQKNQIRSLQLRSEISRLARSMNLEYPDALTAFPASTPTVMTCTSGTSSSNSIGLQQQEHVGLPISPQTIESHEVSPTSMIRSPNQQQQQPRPTILRRHKPSSRARSNSLKYSIMSILTSSSSSKDLNAVTTGNAGSEPSSVQSPDSVSAVSPSVTTTAASPMTNRDCCSMKNEIYHLEVQLNTMNNQIYKKEDEAMRLIQKFRCYNYNISEENANASQLLAVDFEYLHQQQPPQGSGTQGIPVLGLPPHPNGSKDPRHPPNITASQHMPPRGGSPQMSGQVVPGGRQEGEAGGPGSTPVLTNGQVVGGNNNFRNSQPVWERDGDAPCCKRCKKKFKTFYRNRHHCRCCGYVFCGKCTSNRMNLPEFGYYDVVRVCNVCYNSGEDI